MKNTIEKITIVNSNTLENKLYELQKACNRYKKIDPLADWVLFAIERYIGTHRATRQFELDFINFPENKFERLIKECMNGDKSDNGIIEKTRKIISR